MRWIHLVWFSVLLLLLAASPVFAAPKKICFRYLVNTIDSNVGEDDAPYPSAAFPAKYGRAYVLQSGAGDVLYYP